MYIAVMVNLVMLEFILIDLYSLLQFVMINFPWRSKGPFLTQHTRIYAISYY